jgi:hypothetical protein
MSERFICPFSTRVGDQGQRYEVWCFDGEGGSMHVGYSDQPDGGSLAQMVHLHPIWHTPWIVDRETPLGKGKLLRAIAPALAEGEDVGDVSDHILRAAGVRGI